jgi:hypothetical protein
MEEIKVLDISIPPDIPVNPFALIALARHMRLDYHPAGDLPFSGWAAVVKEYCELHRIGFRSVPNG